MPGPIRSRPSQRTPDPAMPARPDSARPAPARQRLHRKKPEYGQTKTARLAYERVIGNVVDLEYDGLTPGLVRDHIPEAWDWLEVTWTSSRRRCR